MAVKFYEHAPKSAYVLIGVAREGTMGAVPPIEW